MIPTISKVTIIDTDLIDIMMIDQINGMVISLTIIVEDWEVEIGMQMISHKRNPKLLIKRMLRKMSKKIFHSHNNKKEVNKVKLLQRKKNKILSSFIMPEMP